MALFGSKRDVSLFRHLNKELIHKIVDTEVLIYKLNLNSTTTNVYEETNNKVYLEPTLVYCLVSMEDQQWNSEDYGSDVNQLATFSFLRDDLVDVNVVMQVGDIVEYKSRFFEIDSIVENQAFVGKDPDSAFSGPDFGYNVSVVCQSHMTRQSKLNIVKTRFGNSVAVSDVVLPKNL